MSPALLFLSLDLVCLGYGYENVLVCMKIFRFVLVLSCRIIHFLIQGALLPRVVVATLNKYINLLFTSMSHTSGFIVDNPLKMPHHT